MKRAKWNRQRKKALHKTKEADVSPKNSSEEVYKVSRVRTRRKKLKHPGFTIIPEHRLWIFENNKQN